jgi:hypothetical protein
VVGAAPPAADSGGDPARNAKRIVDEGRQIFRYDTFGDEAFWSDALLLDDAISSST